MFELEIEALGFLGHLCLVMEEFARRSEVDCVVDACFQQQVYICEGFILVEGGRDLPAAKRPGMTQ